MSGISRIGHARWGGDIRTGKGQLTAESGAYHELPYTFASRTSEMARLTDPEELLATAHAGCFAMSLTNVLTQEGQPPTEITVSAEVALAPTSAGRRITASEVTVEGQIDGSTEDGWFARMVQTADERCPFSALIRDAGGTVTVTSSLR